MINIKEHKVAFDKNVIDRFEQQNGFKLPNEYVEFLKEYNGGRPEANIVKLKECEFDSCLISSFFGVNRDDNNHILYQFNILKKRIPGECIPIADVEGGNVICLNLSADRNGYIYLWDHEVELVYGEKITIDNMCFVAKSFTEFLKMIERYNPQNEDLSDYKTLEVYVNPDFLKKIRKEQGT